MKLRKIASCFFIMLGMVGISLLLFLRPTKASCRLEELILEEKMMPSKWSRTGLVIPPVLPKNGAHDALGVVYESGSELAFNNLYIYKNGWVASISLWVNHELFFSSGLTQWTVVKESKEWGLHGDEENIQCGASTDPLLGFRCKAVIRYGPYITAFSLPMENENWNIDEFGEIVVALDNHINSCLSSR